MSAAVGGRTSAGRSSTPFPVRRRPHVYNVPATATSKGSQASAAAARRVPMIPHPTRSPYQNGFEKETSKDRPLPSFPIKGLFGTAPRKAANQTHYPGLYSDGSSLANGYSAPVSPNTSTDLLSTMSGVTDFDTLFQLVKQSTAKRKNQSDMEPYAAAERMKGNDTNLNTQTLPRQQHVKILLEDILADVAELGLCLNSELNDCSSIMSSFAAANSILTELTEAEAAAQEVYEALQNTVEEDSDIVKIVTQARGIESCSNRSLDAALDKLSEGLKAITIASSTPSDERSRHYNKPIETLNLSRKLKSMESFKLMVDMPISIAEGKTEKMCSRVIERLQELRSLQSWQVERMRYQQMGIIDIQRKVSIKLNNYKNTKDMIGSFEKHRKQLTEQVALLCGEGDYSNLSAERLQELNQQVIKISRKIIAELTIREMKSPHHPQSVAELENNDICFVCSERIGDTVLSPCNHILCKQCGNHLNYCPHCRAKITKRTLYN